MWDIYILASEVKLVFIKSRYTFDLSDDFGSLILLIFTDISDTCFMTAYYKCAKNNVEQLKNCKIMNVSILPLTNKPFFSITS